MSWTKTKKGFGRPSREDAIAAFWKFWPTIADAVAEGIVSEGMKPEHIAAMAEHVSTIHPKLDWELGPGRASKHHLCLSGKGDPILRAIAEQWLRQAPPPDATWEYYASRQAHGRDPMTLEIAKSPDVPESGYKVALAELVCGVKEDDAREMLEVQIFHPIFATIDDEELKVQITFIGLDNLLGEDAVERWLVVEQVDERPEGAVPLVELTGAIESFRTKCTGDKWAVLEGTKDGKPIFVSKNTALKRIDHLLLDMHVEIAIGLRSPTADGLTTNEEAESLNTMEDALLELLGKEAAYVGRETHGGVRTMHLHVMEGGPAASAIETWRVRNPTYAMKVSVRSDPRWDVLGRWD